ncbi:MAG: threonine--tRNA ligase [Candidatus Auribacter fodinae]|uniref:Threonine--tRNA ligase n=1 Tax=Candidatus Auribacter fodinae TaxID=2093366 RepID=A0A3A4RD75_9BACT|nr:MAG: threonine--tRNA ligase [Candidatus Auribacter fodinae]
MQDLERLRHSASHIMAQAVMEMFPGTKLAIGPAIKDGFYYDFDLPRPITPDDLPKIEDRMQEIIDGKHPFTHRTMTKDEAIAYFRNKGQDYKVEIIEDLGESTVSLFAHDTFEDLCRGPHVEHTGEVKAFKLLQLAGAYWRGDEKNKMLQRIYGTAFDSQKELKKYLLFLEEAKKRDHRKIGKDLDLFSIQDQAGPGLVFWHPKGACIRNIIETFWRNEHLKNGYDLVYIPHILKSDLWKTSGHWEYYRDNMYSPIQIDEQEFVLKPMNCPGHILMYKSKLRSYRELPLRWAELGTVYRYERSGVLHGLLRVRGFTQDDAHIFCLPEQLEQEIENVLNMTSFMMKTFGFNYNIYLSTQPEKYAGTQNNWDAATKALEEALKTHNVPYQVDPGEGVFYGPKIDIKLIDALGREWQGPTIQVDFNLPQRFNVAYIGSDGQEHNAVMVHRTVLGSMERFMGVLTEHYAGAFPAWLSPVQVRVINLSDNELNYSRKIYDILRQELIRCDTDFSDEKLGNKIRKAQVEQIPYMLVIGAKEVENNVVCVRHRRNKELLTIPVEEFIRNLKVEVEQKQ